MPTERLYFTEPLLCSFEARVVGRVRHDGRASILLDRSAFYPGSGGQMADRGRLGELDEGP
jgi:Ser-tRNA(Ala) deacylase AlaX